MSAEFAIMMPVLLVVLGLAIGAILLTTHRLTLTSAASEIARLEARGDTNAAAARVALLGERVLIQREDIAGIWCVTVTENPASGLLSFIEIGARGCAASSVESVR